MNHRETRASSATPWTLALLIVACGDSEAPLPSSALAQAIALEYGSGAASAGSAASGSGAPTGAPSESDRDTTGSEPDDSELDAADADDDDPEDVAPTLPEPDPEPEPEPSASFPDCDGFSIIQANCGQGGCHGGASNLGNFAESEEAARSYIGRSGALTCASRGPIIDPQNPGESVLVQKLSDDPPCGNYMPPSASFLPAADVECITNWIANLE